MKIRHAVLLIVLGFLFDIFGVAKKIMHHPGETMFFVIGVSLKILGIFLLLFTIMKKKV